MARQPTARKHRRIAGIATAAVAAFAVAAVSAGSPPHETTDEALSALRSQYRRPSTLPVPAANPLTKERIELGRRLFAEKRLSADTTIACATCHDPALAFTDGAALGKGIAKVPLDRHTPSLWNLAWSRTLFWDGRASSLEEQARVPIENPKEMGQPLARGVDRLANDASYQADFAKAFPEAPGVSETNLLKALAAFERTFVSPPTKFDDWLLGADDALNESEVKGFLLFNGKAKCSSCHSGWNFTDYAYHDIGLPGTDLGRGPVSGLAKVNHAFKTPSLRELVWTAPYMHDGSLASLEDVLHHYASGGIARASRSPDMPNVVDLDEEERNDLMAFLETLSSARPPRPSANISALIGARPESPPAAVAATEVSQKNKLFVPGSITIERGASLTVINDDTRPHNVRVYDERMKFDSGVQEAGDKAVITFKLPGMFEAFCGIHPNMRLTVEVR